MLPNSSSTFKAVAIIVAGGSGSRMQSAVPKQFLPINGRPVLMHTLEAFAGSTYQPQLIVVLPEPYHAYWKELCTQYQFNGEHTLIKGGSTRFHSVKNAVDTLTDERTIVAVHDAVRPLISAEIIDACYEQAILQGNAIAAVKSRDSVRRLSENKTESLLRDEIYLVQTPQTFQLTQLKAAYQLPYTDAFTDDASVVEQAGYTIHIAEGNYQNFKITYAEDIAIAEMLLQKKQAALN
ncbi:2-C-methyl-D-erythritol 4-phosphate cytidylyltransferase [Mucilaginibacter koreensis]